MKTINKNAYTITKKHETNSIYDNLLCSTCGISCLRCNFSRHKLSPKHINLIDIKDVECLEIVSDSSPSPSPSPNRKTSFFAECDTEVVKQDSNTLDTIDRQVVFYEDYPYA